MRRRCGPYEELGARVIEPPSEARGESMPEEASLDARIEYGFRHAVLVVEEVGADVVDQVEQTIEDLSDTELNAIYVDLPLRSPNTPEMTEQLRGAGFLFGGLVPRFHRERDHLRLQRPFVSLDPDAIVVYSDLAHRIKDRIVEEL